MEDINVIDTSKLLKLELLGFMVEKDIIKSSEYLKWDDLSIKERALYITKALEMLGVI
jgi:hypothetical protein